MKDELIRYDHRYMRNAASEVRALAPRIREAHENVERLRLSGTQGFFDLPYDARGARQIQTLASQTSSRFRDVLVIGIGGSDLGARAAYRAVGGTKMRLRFLTNPDPDAVAATLEETDWRQTAVNVVSKSGTTLETMALFEIVRRELRRRVGKTSHRSHVRVTTETSDASALYRLARREGYEVIPHPPNVGGRFSVLSAVGLYPLACSGTDVSGLLEGARWIESQRRSHNVKSISARFTTHQFLALEKGKGIHVLMPYAEALFPFALWYRQLWAESLGKRRGSEHVGPTPVASYGPADQHSQIQLYNDGPNDKAITFVQCDRFKRAIRVPGGPSLTQILHAEREGTARALARNGRPNGTIHIGSVSTRSLGALFMLYETSVAHLAELLSVNAFDQPGVEAGKKETRRLLDLTAN